MSNNLSSLAARKGITDTLFERLTTSVGDNNSADEQRKALAKEFLVGESNIVGTASFYDFIQGENAGKRAYICNGSSCLCAGQADVKHAISQVLPEEEIGHVTCLGRCHENKAFQIDGINYSGSDLSHLNAILDNKDDSPSGEKYRVFSPIDKPVFVADHAPVSEYYQLFSKLQQDNEPDAVLAEIKESNLRGRGGAGFPTAIKWQAARNAISDEKYIVCNADEGDPGAFSDRYIMEERPHTLLLGMLVAGWLSGAKWGVLYIRDEYPASITACEQAIQEFDALNIAKSGDWSFSFKIIRGAGAYICGEETALLRSIEGQRPMVSVRPPFPVEKGLFNQPTILNNVETFAAVPWILNHGGSAFAAMGNGRSTGSKLVSLDGSFNEPGIYEVEMATPLQDVVDMAGGFSRDLKALHIGGPLGGLVPLSAVSALTLDFESFASNNFLLGHASIIGVPQSMSMVDYAKHLFEFTAAESCGKCFPCRLGATRGKEMLDDALAGKHQIDKDLLDDLLETMELGSLCALGGGVPLPINNALQYFENEFRPYFEGGR